MAKKTRPRFDVHPAAPSLVASLKLLGFDATPYVKPPIDPEGDLDRYRTAMWDNLSGRTIGNHADLLEVWRHAMESKHRPITLQAEARAKGGTVVERQNYAAVNLQAAAQTLEVALILHTAKDSWFATTVVSIARIALELAAKAAFIAMGSDDEPKRWRSAHVLRPEHKSKAARIKMWECLDVLRPLLSKREPKADAVQDVYNWLCGYVHFDARTLTRAPKHETAFAALAYVGWVVAVTAEIVTGFSPIATWPARWPKSVPWS